jgi:hyperosmotically inducible periplasmic protein
MVLMRDQFARRAHTPGVKNQRSFTMIVRNILVATTTAVALLGTVGCAVTRGQESVGAYVDDTTITTQVKSRFVENKEVDASSISVETLNGTVMLSGFAKNASEKSTAEGIARRVSGVKAVKNEIAVRP